MDFVRDADNHGFIVHHKEHLNANNIYNPAVTINFDNLELLCLNCHNSEHFTKNDFTADGEVKAEDKNILELAGVYKIKNA